MSLSVGDVFWLVNPDVHSPESHLHTVVGITEEKNVYYTFFTSDNKLVKLMCMRAEGKKDIIHLNTYVEGEPQDCSELSHTSYMNVNLSFSKSEYVLRRLRTFQICEAVKISDELLRKIDIALLSSPTKSAELGEIVRSRLNIKPITK